MWFKVGGTFPANFQRLLATKLYVGCKNILEAQEWYGPHPSITIPSLAHGLGFTHA